MLSIIIPTYNRDYILKKCLQALHNQQIDDHALEIIVSDDGSTDDTEQITREFSRHSRWPIQYLKQTNQGANAARNAAIRLANGELLLFINDDILPVPTMARHHVRTHEKYSSPNIGVLGRVTVADYIPYSTLAKLHLDASFDNLSGKTWLDWSAFFTCNVSVKKDFLLQYGLFEESLRYHEDVELSERLSAYDFKLIYNPEALGIHEHYLQEDDFLKIARRDGTALAIWFKKSPHIGKKITRFGFYPAASLGTKIKYKAADLLFNRSTIPFFLLMAKYFSLRCEMLSLGIYRKIYQAEKRKAIHDELSK